jgi:hypothetical protein
MSSNVPLPPPRRRSSPLLWILAILGGIVLLMIVVAVGSGVFIAYKAKQAGVDSELMRRDPGLAMARMMAALAPNMDIVSVDRGRNVVTMRNRKTGKTITLSLDDARRGRISIEGENGERVAVIGGGPGGRTVRITPGENAPTFGRGAVTLPDWLPAYSGTAPRGAQSTQDNIESGDFQFVTPDSPRQVLDFYEAALKKAGLAPNVMREADGGMLSARDDKTKREAVVTAERRGGTTSVSGTFSTKK